MQTMSSVRRLPAATLSTLFFAMHAGAFRLGATTGVLTMFLNADAPERKPCLQIIIISTD